MTLSGRRGAAAVLACVLLSANAWADDLAVLRAELDRIKSEYTARTAALEARIAELEA